MPFRELNVEEVAQYLHLSRADVELLVKRAEIPHEKRGGRQVFRRREIDEWASQRILGFGEKRLHEYHAKTTQSTRQQLGSEALMPLLVKPAHIAPAMAAKTRASVLRELVALADSTGFLMDPPELLKSLEERETLCPTGLPGGMAIPHPRHHQPFLFSESFIILGRCLQEIPFGAPDGQRTDLFFLLCCQDDRLHLHVLARLCLVAQKTDLLIRLRAAGDAEAMHAELTACETAALEGKK
jgi:PTS system nitrogen regulatory IIA component